MPTTSTGLHHDAELCSCSSAAPATQPARGSSCKDNNPDAMDAVQPSATAEVPLKRQWFWRNVVKQFNFTNQAERQLLIRLTQGVSWMHTKRLPMEFIQRHREIYHLIATADYKCSSTIQRDVTRTFSIFEQGPMPSGEITENQGALFRVLNALAEAENGYCQGMNFIAALFLVEGIEEADAYALFLYILKKRHLARIYQRSSTFLDEYLHHFDRMFQKELPDLYQHMHGQGFSIPMYGIEWFTTLFSLSTKLDLACAIFDMFFIGVQDIFLRMGLAILKLLESTLMCMHFEDFLKEFKPLVRQLDPYQAVFQALLFAPNPLVKNEDTTENIARTHFLLSSHINECSAHPTPPRSFGLHRTLPPPIAHSIMVGNFAQVSEFWQQQMQSRGRCSAIHRLVLANELLHFAIWFNQVAIACFAIEQCGADVDNTDDTNLTPLHFSIIRNQPDMMRLLLCFGADRLIPGGRWSEDALGYTPLETAKLWTYRDTTAARLVLEKDICLFCNSRFEKLTFAKERCRRCRFFYCRRSHSRCIDKHQCPRDYEDKEQSSENETREDEELDTSSIPRRVASSPANMDLLDPPKDPAGRHRSASYTATPASRQSFDSGSQRETLSRSASESSSFVFINSPVEFSSASSVIDQQEANMLDQLSHWFRKNGSPPTPKSETNGKNQSRVAIVEKALEFPDRPEWYCNATSCHSVFAFFSQGLECSRCGGFFCSHDFNAKTKQCSNCEPLDQLPCELE